MPSTIDQQITEVEREIRMRRRLYATQIAKGAKSQELAEQQIALMQDVLATLINYRAVIARDQALDRCAANKAQEERAAYRERRAKLWATLRS